MQFSVVHFLGDLNLTLDYSHFFLASTGDGVHGE